jgi:hypothetical protein
VAKHIYAIQPIEGIKGVKLPSITIALLTENDLWVTSFFKRIAPRLALMLALYLARQTDKRPTLILSLVTVTKAPVSMSCLT